jgi:fatty-acid desaturase
MLQTCKTVIKKYFIGKYIVAYHNDHQRYPGRIKRTRWFEIDPTYRLMCLLRMAKIIQWNN